MPDELGNEIVATAPQQDAPITREQPPAEQPHVDEPPDPASLQAEIEELQKKREKAAADAEYWRKQKAEARAEYFRDRQPQPPQPSQAPVSPQEPQLKDFEDYDKYVAALVDFKADQKKKQWEIEAANKSVQEATIQRATIFQQKLNEGAEKYEDFERVVFDQSAVHFNPMVVDILQQLDSPADVAYYLAKNRPEGIAISRMTPFQASRAIAKIEDEIAKTKPNPNHKSITNAPPPINPIGSREQVTKDPEKMSGKEYEAWLRGRGVKMY